MSEVSIADNRFCFICGDRNPVGLKTRPKVDKARHSAECALVIPPEFQGWDGVVHGGIVSALLDEVAAYAAMAIAKPVVTAELTVRYLKPVPVGREVVARAEVREQVRRSIFVDAELACDGQVMARAQVRMYVVKPPA